MIKKVLPFLNKFLPRSVALKGLSKINPKFSQFIAKATAAGYGANEVLDFMRTQLGPTEEEGLRSDELSAMARVKQSEAPLQLAKSAGKVGLGLATAGVVPTVLSTMFEGNQQESGQPDIKNKYPDFFSFIEKELSQGRDPAQAAAVANVQGFAKHISDIQKETGMNIEDYLSSIYGQSFKPSSEKSVDTQQPNLNADQALMNALQKILSM